jgi:hypothetical protein
MILGPKIRCNKHMIERCLRYHSPEEIVAHFERIGYSKGAVRLMIHRVQAELEHKRQKLERKIFVETHLGVEK